MVHRKLNNSPDNGTFATNSELVGRRSGFHGPAKAGRGGEKITGGLSGCGLAAGWSPPLALVPMAGEKTAAYDLKIEG